MLRTIAFALMAVDFDATAVGCVLLTIFSIANVAVRRRRAICVSSCHDERL